MACGFLLGVAHQRGVKVHIPTGSTLLDHDLPDFFYGYTDQPKGFGVTEQERYAALQARYKVILEDE